MFNFFERMKLTNFNSHSWWWKVVPNEERTAYFSFEFLIDDKLTVVRNVYLGCNNFKTEIIS